MTSATDLDPTAMERLKRLGGNKFLVKMISLFLEYGAEKLGEARSAQSAGDLAATARAVHPLKSSAGNVGASRLQRLATEAEQRAVEGDAAAVVALMAEIESAFEVVKPLLESEKAKAMENGEAG